MERGNAGLQEWTIFCRGLDFDGAQGTDQAKDRLADSSAPSQPLLKPEQRQPLVRPIALYPVSLLVNVLAASTYPLEVVAADRWITERRNLKGDKIKTEVDKQSWDDSVKALVSTPTVLAMMNQKIEWTRNLGNALLAQQPGVTDAIQRLRTRAYDDKKLTTTKQQKVTIIQEQAKERIDEIDAVSTSLEAKVTEMTVDSYTKAEQLIADLHTKRDEFQENIKKEVEAGETASLEAKTNLESQW